MKAGLQEGQERMRRLMLEMAENGEADELIRLTEPDFLEEMLRKYRIQE